MYTRTLFSHCANAHVVFTYMLCTDSTIDQSFATAEEKNLLHGKFWSQVKRIIGNNPDAVLFKPVKRSNVKDMQDMSYMLYI